MNLRERIKALQADEGVSPVIAVILMVAITVVLAATVYVWVSGFASDQSGPEQASATAKGVDLDDNGDVEWVQVTLTSGENAPYKPDDVTAQVTDPEGVTETDLLCESAQGTGADHGAGTTASCTNTPWFSTTNDWEAGASMWFPCAIDSSGDSGTHLVSLSVRDSTILDTSVTCHQQAT